MSTPAIPARNRAFVVVISSPRIAPAIVVPVQTCCVQ
jgi:hypothetical protein